MLVIENYIPPKKGHLKHDLATLRLTTISYNKYR